MVLLPVVVLLLISNSHRKDWPNIGTGFARLDILMAQRSQPSYGGFVNSVSLSTAENKATVGSRVHRSEIDVDFLLASLWFLKLARRLRYQYLVEMVNSVFRYHPSPVN